MRLMVLQEGSSSQQAKLTNLREIEQRFIESGLERFSNRVKNEKPWSAMAEHLNWNKDYDLWIHIPKYFG